MDALFGGVVKSNCLLPAAQELNIGLRSLNRPATVPARGSEDGKETERKAKKDSRQHGALGVRSPGEGNVCLR
jgi:hypothetical protein